MWFGGVVPEVASRAHLEAMVPTLQRACAAADIDLSEIDGVAVTAGPGLMGALVVGLASAKALAYTLNKPLYGVNHLVGHVAVDLLEHGPLPERCIALLVSGGHTSLLEVASIADSVVELGSTIDDAAGGVRQDRPAAWPAIPEALHRQGCHRRPQLCPVPARPHRPQGSGAAPLRFLLFRPQDRGGSLGRGQAARRARCPGCRCGGELQEAVCDVLSAKAMDACTATGASNLLIGGGVAANRRLRALLAERAGERGISLRTPRPNLCTDNGAMIAVLGAEIVAAGGKPSALDIGADSSLPVSKILV